MDNNIKEYGNFNSRIIALRNAYAIRDTKTVRLLIDQFKEKRDYYSNITVDELKANLDAVQEKRFTTENLTEEDKEQLKEDMLDLKQKLVEKKAFVKNADVVDEICNEQLDNLVEEKANRTIRNRRIATVAAIAGGVILLALGAKGCKDSKNNKVSDTTPTTIVTIEEANNDILEETTSTYEFEETEPIETEGYNIDPLIGETTRRNSFSSSSNNGGSNSAGSTNSTGTSSVTNTTNGTTPSVVIPGVGDSEVVISTNPDGHIESITWPTTETTIPNPVIPDTTPTGTDPLPIEPTVIVLPTPTNTPAPTSTPEPTPTAAPTPAIPTGTIPGETPDVTPTPIPLPTDAPRPATPTPIPEPDPTTSTLPPIPTGDVEGEEDIEYNKTFTGNTPTYIEEIRNIPDPINYVETRNIPGVITIEHTYLEEPGLTEEIRNIPEETVTEHDYFAGKARRLKR